MVQGIDPRIRLRCVWQQGWHQPLASSWALWSELCRRNGLTRPEASWLLDEASLTRSVLTARETSGWLAETLDLSAVARGEACAVHEFDDTAVAMYRLRHCAYCAGQRYHTACFQHLALSVCPIHLAPLEDRCQVCGGLVSVTYEAARCVPFGCARCGSWLGVPGYPLPPPGVLQSVIGATARSLSRGMRLGDRSSGASANRIYREALDAVDFMGHVAWWGDEDPYVGGSAWRPLVRLLKSFSVEPDDLLHASAWQTLAGFVTLHAALMGTSEDIILAASELLDQGRSRLMPHWQQPLSVWALAGLVSRYGGASPLRKAKRLIACHAPNHLFPLTPQATSPVQGHAAANCLVFEAELRQELMAIWRLVRRIGREALEPAVADQKRKRIGWRLEPSADGYVKVIWRAWSDHGYRRLLRKRHFH